MKNNIKNRELILNDVISLFCTAATSYAKRMTILKANCRLDLPFIEDDTNHPTREFLNCIPADKMGSGSMVVATRKVLYETFKNAFPDLSLIEIFSFNEKYHKYFDNTPEAVIQVYEEKRNAYPKAIIEHMNNLLISEKFDSFNRWILFISCFPICESDDCFNFLFFINCRILELKKNDNAVKSERQDPCYRKESELPESPEESPQNEESCNEITQVIPSMDFLNEYLNLSKENQTSGIDLTFFAGTLWRVTDARADILRKLNDHHIPCRIIINEGSEITNAVHRHMKNPNKSLDPAIDNIKRWYVQYNKFANSLQVRICPLPLLRSYCHIRNNPSRDALRIFHYVYGNGYLKRSCIQILLNGNPKFEVFTNEFEYLWDISIDIAEYLNNEHTLMTVNQVFLDTLHAQLLNNQDLMNSAGTTDLSTFTNSIFPPAFNKAFEESYKEFRKSYELLSTDDNKHKEIIDTLSKAIYQELRKLGSVGKE